MLEILYREKTKPGFKKIMVMSGKQVHKYATTKQRDSIIKVYIFTAKWERRGGSSSVCFREEEAFFTQTWAGEEPSRQGEIAHTIVGNLC